MILISGGREERRGFAAELGPIPEVVYYTTNPKVLGAQDNGYMSFSKETFGLSTNPMDSGELPGGMSTNSM